MIDKHLMSESCLIYCQYSNLRHFLCTSDLPEQNQTDLSKMLLEFRIHPVYFSLERLSV